ncbi:hypothetical protein [Nannocystis sp. SCPEA4]|uniref:hypothetical protein n=1 Tax=Nannocystis sp. SCPEA4 TaxID=2996787 RepID=UPI00226EB7F1|nr:hypothetical protein [Nannocystis sp. SCPEA4]MCY1056443.1 hypothetical protein [Nannocystis sp. SCPEA4]
MPAPDDLAARPTGPEPPGSSASERPVRLVLAALAIVAFHLAWFAYFVPLDAWYTSTPIAGVDFETHVGQTWRFIEAMDGWGHSWMYDPRLLAGYLHGVIFDADNKGWEVWTWLLSHLGVPPGFAFNLFVALAHLGVLPVVYASARLFDLSRRGALWAAFLASCLWFFDSFSHWCWWIGMVAYAICGYLSLLPLALFYRWLRDRKPWQGLAAGLALGVAHLVHPYTFIVLVAPMLVLYLRALHRLDARGHFAVLAMAVFTLVLNTWWLSVALQFWHYILDSGFFGQSGPEWLLADYLGLVLDTATSGLLGTRTGFRFLVLGAALVGLWRWRKARDPRTLPLATAMLVMALLAYASGYIWLFRQIQPYRHVLPLAFLAVIPAAAALESTRLREAWRSLAAPGRLLVVVLALPALQALARDILYFTPAHLPEVAPLYSGEKVLLAASGYPAHPDYRLFPARPEHGEMTKWVREVDDGQSRFLVEEPAVGERLHWQTDAQIIGGFRFRNLEHSMANLYRRHKFGVAGDDQLRTYFETYAVRWIIVTSNATWWNQRPDLIVPAGKVGHHRIFRTTIEPHLIQQGGGQVVAAPNKLTVTGSDPNIDLVLRFHWMEYLVCEPGCEIRRERIDDLDHVGFIRVPAPHPADLEIVNGYGEAGR